MIKQITIRNKNNSLEANFLDGAYFRLKYGVTCRADEEAIAFENLDFIRLQNQEIGFFGLSNNSNNFEVGIDENGSTFLNNYYENRQLLWRFQIFTSSIPKLDTLFYQTNTLLEIEVTTYNNNMFIIDGTLVGRYETGFLEINCPNPFFKKQDSKINECYPLLLNPVAPYLIPSAGGFKVNKVYFTSTTANQQKAINVPIQATPIITLTGGWQNAVIKNISTGSVLTIPLLCAINCVIDTENLTVLVDGNDVTQLCYGTYPDFQGGENILDITFGLQTVDITVCYEYLEVYASVF